MSQLIALLARDDLAVLEGDDHVERRPAKTLADGHAVFRYCCDFHPISPRSLGMALRITSPAIFPEQMTETWSQSVPSPPRQSRPPPKGARSLERQFSSWGGAGGSPI